MENKRSSNLALILLTLIAFITGYIFGQSPNAPISIFRTTVGVPDDVAESFSPFWEVWDLIHENYFDQPLDDPLLIEGAIDGMLAVLDDPNTRYLSPEDQAMTEQNIEGEIQGIGAEVTEEDGNITIVSPIEGSPAEAAGLQPGDILRTSDGAELTGMSVLEAALLVRGPKGSIVLLGIERDGELFEVEIERDTIRIPSVRGEVLEEGIAYVRLTQFGIQTDEELAELLPTLLEDNPTGLILDLRRNPGGSLDTAVNISEQFLAEGAILIERFGDGREREFDAEDGEIAETIPMAVLIDEGSASASEVLAGAIQDRERGILIGQTSFGKGTVQSWQELSNGGGVRITIARWLTPEERWVHEEGLTPEYFIPLTESEEDEQLDAAIDYLLGENIISIPPEEPVEE